MCDTVKSDVVSLNGDDSNDIISFRVMNAVNDSIRANKNIKGMARELINRCSGKRGKFVLKEYVYSLMNKYSCKRYHNRFQNFLCHIIRMVNEVEVGWLDLIDTQMTYSHTMIIHYFAKTNEIQKSLELMVCKVPSKLLKYIVNGLERNSLVDVSTIDALIGSSCDDIRLIGIRLFKRLESIHDIDDAKDGGSLNARIIRSLISSNNRAILLEVLTLSVMSTEFNDHMVNMVLSNSKIDRLSLLCINRIDFNKVENGILERFNTLIGCTNINDLFNDGRDFHNKNWGSVVQLFTDVVSKMCSFGYRISSDVLRSILEVMSRCYDFSRLMSLSDLILTHCDILDNLDTILEFLTRSNNATFQLFVVDFLPPSPKIFVMCCKALIFGLKRDVVFKLIDKMSNIDGIEGLVEEIDKKDRSLDELMLVIYPLSMADVPYYRDLIKRVDNSDLTESVKLYYKDKRLVTGSRALSGGES